MARVRHLWLKSCCYLLCLVAMVAVATPARAQDWLMLESEGFTVVSDLGEGDVREWAEEFENFLTALHRLLPLNRRLLPPLTAVVFKRSGGFAPYRLRTESGLVGGNSGIFINSFTWSVIGMPGVRGAESDHSTTYHEAVHWFMSADPTRYPLWFSEGIAELFSTFEVADGQSKWARPIAEHLDYLQFAGLQPMAEFLEVSQDQAMHANATYYSQAWLFVHYLTFGRPDGPALLSRFLIASGERPPLEAFREVFAIEPGEMDDLLRDYLQQDRFNTGGNPAEDSGGTEFPVTPAPQETVEISLARLALGTRNYELFEMHIANARAIAPESPEPYDLLASWYAQTERDDFESFLDEAIARGSVDARTWELKAIARTRALRRNGPLFTMAAFDAGDAREIADYLTQSIRLRPLNRTAFRLLADVLYSVDSTSDADMEAVEIGSIVYPREAAIPMGQAALALKSGDTTEAGRLVGLALGDTYRLEGAERSAAEALRRRLAQ
jgi:hypothetical protein